MIKMKILVISDSHLYENYLENVIKEFENQVDLLIHCGDSKKKKNNRLMQKFDIAVLGNHDEDDYPVYTTYQNILATHGHRFNVYKGYEKLIDLCHKKNCQFCFHGHTHVPTYQKHEGIIFINPGSLMMNRGSYGYGTFALVDITNNHFDIQFLHHETYQICDQTILEEGIKLLEEFKKLV